MNRDPFSEVSSMEAMNRVVPFQKIIDEKDGEHPGQECN
jgi:hypothetical protein